MMNVDPAFSEKSWQDNQGEIDSQSDVTTVFDFDQRFPPISTIKQDSIVDQKCTS